MKINYKICEPKDVEWNGVPHEYLTKEDYRESSSPKGQRDYICEQRHGTIKKGEKHVVHKFYGEGEYPTYRTHKICSSAFKKSLN